MEAEMGGGDAASSIVIPTWLDFFDGHLIWPLTVQLAVTLLLNVLSVFYVHSYNKRGSLYSFIHAYIGTQDKVQVTHPAFIVVCCILQLLLSIGSVCMFAMRTYTREVSAMGHVVEVAMSSFFALHYFVARMQAGFSPASAWAPSALVDVITVVPVLLPFVVGIPAIPVHLQWLSLAYLRSYRALTAYQRLERTVGLGEVSEFYRRLLLSFLRTAAMVICMGCSIFILEVLGEIPGWEDTFITTRMGELSFVQMIYWMFTTISTVGYGDFSPTTGPSRLVIIAFIVGGVAFFGAELEGLLEVRKLLHDGKGRYVPRDRETMHIVATGPGVAKLSSTMESFLGEMLDSESVTQTPDVVLLSELPFDEELMAFARTELPPGVRRNVHFLVGSAMMARDLARARLRRCAMAFVIPQTTADDALAEDGRNILRATEMTRYHPRLQLRLMLLQPESKMRAMNIGIEQGCCFSALEQKINLLAQSTRVRGFLPLVGGLLQVTTPFHYREALQQAADKDRGWMLDHLASLRRTTYGLAVSEALAGLDFRAAVAKVYEESEGAALVIAAQHNGCLVLNFEGTLEKGQVVIAIACSREVCSRFTNASVDWRIAFLQRREHALYGSKSRIVQLSNLKQEENMESGDAVAGRSPRRVRTRTVKFQRAVSENSNFGDDEHEQTVDRLARSRDVREAQDFLSDPCLVTLVVARGAGWQQVVVFLRTLRQPFLPSHPPIIVLSSTAPPLSVVETFKATRTVFLVGPVLRVHNLLEAGVQRAQTVIVLCGEQRRDGPGASTALVDHDAVLLANTVEQLLAGSGRSQYAVYEFATTQAARLVEHVLSGPGRARPSLQSLKSTLPHQAPGHGWDDSSILALALKRAKRMLNPFWRTAQVASNVYMDLFSNTDLAEDRLDGEDAELGLPGPLGGKLLFQRRFAAGQAFTLDLFGSVLGHIFHFPPTIELLEALTMPARRGQAAYPWQVLCPPEWAGRTFGELQLEWLLGKDPELLDGGAAVLALFRQAPAADGYAGPLVGGCNVTLPARGTELRATDLITVLAGHTFGQTMARRGLLSGTAAAAVGSAAPQLPHSASVPSMASIPEGAAGEPR